MDSEGNINTMKTWITISLILSSALIILTYKYNKGKVCAALCQSSESLVELNEKRLLNLLQENHPTPNAPLHLFVWVEPSLDCPSCLYEADRWIKPVQSHASIYNYTLIMSDLYQDESRVFLEYHSIPKRNLLVLPESHPLLAFHRLGVLKVLVRGGSSVKWFELGNK